MRYKVFFSQGSQIFAYKHYRISSEMTMVVGLYRDTKTAPQPVFRIL
jgi:hypothetical protein